LYKYHYSNPKHKLTKIVGETRLECGSAISESNNTILLGTTFWAMGSHQPRSTQYPTHFYPIQSATL